MSEVVVKMVGLEWKIARLSHRLRMTFGPSELTRFWLGRLSVRAELSSAGRRPPVRP